MKDQSEPITADEWLLRRVRIERFNRADRPLSPNAFEPRVKGRDPDTDGISLYRASCLSDPVEVLATVPLDKQPENGIVRVSVKTVLALGLTIRRVDDNQVRGHVCLEELNATAYAANPDKFTAIKEALAAEATRDENIVRYPPVALPIPIPPAPPSP